MKRTLVGVLAVSVGGCAAEAAPEDEASNASPPVVDERAAEPPAPIAPTNFPGLVIVEGDGPINNIKQGLNREPMQYVDEWCFFYGGYPIFCWC